MLTMKTRALLAVASALALTAGLATSASAASGYETYQCPKVDYHDGTFVWDCNGLWYAGTPRVRTFRAEVTETYNENTRYESTGAQSITSTDGRKKLVVWYCRYGANTRSTEKGRTQVGGGRANTYTWTGGFFPCNGTDRGLEADVYATYGSGTWITTITWNDPEMGGEGFQYAHPWRTCSC
jgi:hypothetical protein